MESIISVSNFQVNNEISCTPFPKSRPNTVGTYTEPRNREKSLN